VDPLPLLFSPQGSSVSAEKRHPGPGIKDHQIIEVVIEFRMPPSGHLIRARFLARNIEQGKSEIQIAHPGCEIIAAYATQVRYKPPYRRNF